LLQLLRRQQLAARGWPPLDAPAAAEQAPPTQSGSKLPQSKARPSLRHPCSARLFCSWLTWGQDSPEAKKVAGVARGVEVALRQPAAGNVERMSFPRVFILLRP